jgi:potassium channel subfamily K
VSAASLYALADHRSMSHVYDLFWSALSLTVFWVVGAALFHVMEGWSYG